MGYGDVRVLFDVVKNVYNIKQDSAEGAHRPHKPEVDGSKPSPAIL